MSRTMHRTESAAAGLRGRCWPPAAASYVRAGPRRRCRPWSSTLEARVGRRARQVRRHAAAPTSSPTSRRRSTASRCRCRRSSTTSAASTITRGPQGPGQPGSPTAPTAMNEVTFTRYRVVYIRADGRNTPGVDVPVSVRFGRRPSRRRRGTPVTAGFELVRHTAKEEAPLRARSANEPARSSPRSPTSPSTGRTTPATTSRAVGSIGITFGNFGDPD